MIQQCVVVFCTNKRAWEYYSVERNIIFCHELKEINLRGILPPQLPLVCVASSDGQIPVHDAKHDQLLQGQSQVKNIPYGCIKPDIEHFLCESFQGYWSSPLQVPCDAPRLQPISQPRRSYLNSVVRPNSYKQS